MASIQIDDVGVATIDGKYRVTWTAVTATGMPTEVFIFKFATRTYSHVASVSDMVYPTTETSAAAWYRQATATFDYPDMTTAQSAKANVAIAIQDLVDAYNSGLTTFLAPTSTVYV